MQWSIVVIYSLTLWWAPQVSSDQEQLSNSDPSDYPDVLEDEDVYPLERKDKPQPRSDESESDVLPGGQVPTDDGKHDAGLPYNFTYNVNDNDTKFSQKVNSDGELVIGEYRVLLPDGRTQIVRYRADWKNGFRSNVTYEGKIKPYVPKKRRPDESDGGIQPGGLTKLVPCPAGYERITPNGRCQQIVPTKRPINENEGQVLPGGFDPKKPQPITCPPGQIKTHGSGKCRPRRPDESEEEVLPGGFTPKPPQPVRCPPGQVKIPGNGKCRPRRPDESEEEVLPGGFTPKPPKPNGCPPGQVKVPENGKCRPLRPNESEEEVLPGGYVPTPVPAKCPFENTKSPRKGNGGCPPGDSKPPLTPSGQPKTVTCGQGFSKTLDKNGKCRPLRPDESEEDIQPGGYLPSATPGPTKCPPGYERYPGKGVSNCQKIPSTKRPDEREDDIQPGGHLPTPCPKGSTYSKLFAKCVPSRATKVPGEHEEDVEPGGYLPTTKSPMVCPPGYQRYPGKGISNCHKIHSPPPKAADEGEDDIQPGGHSPSTPHAVACTKGSNYSKLIGKCIPPDDRNKCLKEAKDKRICFPELCYPGSVNPKCRKPGPDETEDDIQPGGHAPHPTKPSTLYGTPVQPFGVRLNPKKPSARLSSLSFRSSQQRQRRLVLTVRCILDFVTFDPRSDRIKSFTCL